MPLERLPVPVLIQGGLAQDREDVALGLGEGFVLVENLKYDRAGVLKKRGGYAVYDSPDFRTGDDLPTDDARSLHSHRGALVAMLQSGVVGVNGGELPLAASYTESGWTQHGAAAPASLRKSTALRIPVASTSNPQLSRVGSWYVLTYLLDKTLCYKQWDATTGAVVQDERVLVADHVVSHRAFEINGEVVVVYKYSDTGGASSTIELRAFRLDPSSGVGTVAGPDLVIYSGVHNSPFDATVDEVTGIDMWVAWCVPLVGVKIAQVALGVGTSLTLGTTLTHAHADATACSIEQNGNGQAWVAFHDSAANDAFLLRYNRSPFALAAPVYTLEAGLNQVKRTAVSKGGWVFWEGDNDSAGGGQGVFFQAFDGAGASIFAVTGRLFWCHLASRPFTRNGDDWVLLRDYRTRGYALFFPDQVAGAPLVGSYHGAICLDSCIDADPTALFPLGAVERAGDDDLWRWAAPVQSGLVTAGSSAVRGRTAVDFVDLDYRRDQEVLQQSCEAAGLLQLAGGMAPSFDGQQVTELGFLRPPFDVGHSLVAGAGSIEGATPAPGVFNRYLYRFTYEWQDERGNWHTSEPSEPVLVEVSLANTLAKTAWSLATLGLTRKGDLLFDTGRNASIAVFRTLKNAPERYYRLTDPNAVTTISERDQAKVAFEDTFSDAQVLALGFGILYTEGGALEHLAVPSALAVCTWGNRQWLVSGEDPRNVLFSKELIPTEGPAFNLLFLSLRFDEEIVALAPQGASLLAWSHGKTYAVSGEGPTDTGALSNWSGPFIVSEAVGCSDARSVVDFPGGVVWLAEQGFHVLAGAGGTPQFIGAPVLDLTRTYNRCRGAAHQPDQGLLLWTLQAANGASLTVVFDYLRGCWYVWTPANSGGTRWPQACCVHNGDHTYASNGGILRQYPGALDDNGTYFAWRLILPWARLDGVLGYQRCWRAVVAIKRATGVDVVMKLRHDEETSVAQSHAWTLASVSAPSSGRCVLDLHIARQKCRSLQVELTEQLTDDTGPETGTVEIYGLQIDIGRKPGRQRLPAANRS